MLKYKVFYLVVAIIIVATIMFSLFYGKNQESTQTVATQSYIIGNYQDKIAVFTQGDKIPIEIYDVYISTLPQKDQLDINNGITVASKTKLRELIEDYTS